MKDLSPLGLHWFSLSFNCLLPQNLFRTAPRLGRPVRWFFHAKMIWTQGALNEYAGWTDPSLQWSHPEYPKLIPALAAQVAFLKKYWNEVIPKASLFIILVPALFWVFSFFKKNLNFLLLVLLLFFSLSWWL